MSKTAIKTEEKRMHYIMQNSQRWKSTGETLRNQRINKGLSIENVAANIAISPATLSKLERGLPVKNADTLEKAYKLYLDNIELLKIKNGVSEGKFITARNMIGFMNSLNEYVKKEHEKIEKIVETLKLIYGDKFVSADICDYPSVVKDSGTEQVAISARSEAIISFHTEETQKYKCHPLQVCYEFSAPIADISKNLQAILKEIKLTIEEDRCWNSEFYKEEMQEENEN